ncbi:MAG: hypothetical protein ACO3FE_20590 [Planctomycetaceae bacterium]
MNNEIRRTKTYQYCTIRDRAGRPAWRDDQTGRWIKAATLARRTGLTMHHIKVFESGRDGYGYLMTYEERTATETELGVCLY